MIFNWFLAGFGNAKSVFLPTLIQLSLGKPITKAIANSCPQIEYCLTIEQNFRLIEFSYDMADIYVINWVQTFQTAKKIILQKYNSNYYECLNLRTFNYLTLKSALKSSEPLLNLARKNLELKMIETFIDRLHHPNSLQQEIITNLLHSQDCILIKIISSFEISAVKRRELIATIEKTIASTAKVQFDLVTNAKSVIELHANEFKIHWNLRQYSIEVQAASISLSSQTVENL